MEFVHHVLETVVNTLSISFNVVLLYLIAYHSNFGTPAYQVMLAVDASLDLGLSILTLLVQPVCSFSTRHLRFGLETGRCGLLFMS